MSTPRLSLSPDILAAANKHYWATMTGDNRPLRDDVLTPFGMAMKLSGYTPVISKGGCPITRECPCCKGGYFTHYRHQEQTLWVCMECQCQSLS